MPMPPASSNTVNHRLGEFRDSQSNHLEDAGVLAARAEREILKLREDRRRLVEFVILVIKVLTAGKIVFKVTILRQDDRIR